MMLTRLLLRPDEMLRLKLTDVYSLHRVVYSCFPVQNEAATRKETAAFLYADEGMRRGVRQVLILSEQKPQPLACGVMENHAIPNNWLEYAAYTFKITLNPARRERASRKIIPIKGREAIHQWFCDKAPHWGIQVADAGCRVDENGVWQFSKKEQPVTLAFARLSGVLQVRDASLFQKTFRNGIGRGKAFGCGMLQIIPLA